MQKTGKRTYEKNAFQGLNQLIFSETHFYKYIKNIRS